MRRTFPFLAGLLTAAVLALLVVAVRGPIGRWYAGVCRSELAETADEQTPAIIAQLAKLGEPGLPGLVEALGSSREQVARAAEAALWRKFDHWEQLGARTAQSRLAVLAESLAEQTPGFDKPARQAAARLADEILRWMPGGSGQRRIQIIAQCQQVLELAWSDMDVADIGTRPNEVLIDHGDADSGTLHSGNSTDRSPAGSATTLLDGNATPLAPREPAPIDPLAGVPPLAGGGLPLGPIHPQPPGPESPRVSDLRSSSDREGNRRARPIPRQPDNGEEPGLNRAPHNVRPLHPGPRNQEGKAEPLRLPDGPPASLEAMPAEPDAVRRAGHQPNDASSPDTAKRDAEMQALDTSRLMRYLRAEDESLAARSHAELSRRGFSAVHFELARRLTHPDPAMRIELARSLPRLTSVDPVPWLMWLSEDPRLEVRLAAIGLMATTGDPALLNRIEQMARSDRDPAVQRVAERLQKARR